MLGSKNVCRFAGCQCGGINCAELERPNDAQDVFLVLGNEVDVNPVTSQAVACPIVSNCIYLLEAHLSQVRQTRAELIAKLVE